MHLNTVYLILANQNDLAEKIQWAEFLCESYQNSHVIIRLFSIKDFMCPENLNPNIIIIHHPSNRPIDPHILIIQQSKLNLCHQFYYITKQPQQSLFEAVRYRDNTICSTLIKDDVVIGYLVHAVQLNNQLNQDINTTNQLKQILEE